ncbi:hypothetical protein MG293_000018 [Ovis ammon polii]|uniref:Uncharacterized protein n=1 Tax=Ovis ammon polii TaxID=230172 RepID=A0AAD4UJZ5_OVIAM|nr:hypothetical protein MG293_000018 [Ovis ammon polii]
MPDSASCGLTVDLSELRLAAALEGPLHNRWFHSVVEEKDSLNPSKIPRKPGKSLIFLGLDDGYWDNMENTLRKYRLVSEVPKSTKYYCENCLPYLPPIKSICGGHGSEALPCQCAAKAASATSWT